ncbi:MAG TPA: hypothetical protein PLD63_05645 [Ignavibacteria bacterium]|nr:hypothetical protein [Ignavibacteria bacterium]
MVACPTQRADSFTPGLMGSLIRFLIFFGVEKLLTTLSPTSYKTLHPDAVSTRSKKINMLLNFLMIC